MTTHAQARAEPRPLPPSLAITPNIPWEHQTLDQLRAELAYWEDAVRSAAGWSSAKAADDFRRRCRAWIERREQEAAQSAG